MYIGESSKVCTSVAPIDHLILISEQIELVEVLR